MNIIISFVISFIISMLVPFLFWCAGFDFDKRGEIAVICAIITVYVFGMCVYFIYEWSNYYKTKY